MKQFLTVHALAIGVGVTAFYDWLTNGCIPDSINLSFMAFSLFWLFVIVPMSVYAARNGRRVANWTKIAVLVSPYVFYLIF